MTAPAPAWPIGTPSMTHMRTPSIVSWWGTRSFKAAGARRVNRSGGSDQCESASTTNISDSVVVILRRYAPSLSSAQATGARFSDGKGEARMELELTSDQEFFAETTR